MSRIEISPDDVEKVRDVILGLGGQLVEKSESSLGVDMYQFRVDGKSVTLFTDNWGGCDLEGSDDLVARIGAALGHGSA